MTLNNYINDQYSFSDLTEKIIRCGTEVHKLLGNCFQGVIYKRALASEFELRNISFEQDFEMPLFYKGEQIGIRSVDFLVEELIMVEIKIVEQLDEIQLLQAQNYLEAYNMQVGLILNFGGTSFDFRSVTNKKFQRQI